MRYALSTAAYKKQASRTFENSVFLYSGINNPLVAINFLLPVLSSRLCQAHSSVQSKHHTKALCWLSAVLYSSAKCWELAEPALVNKYQRTANLLNRITLCPLPPPPLCPTPPPLPPSGKATRHRGAHSTSKCPQLAHPSTKLRPGQLLRYSSCHLSKKELTWPELPEGSWSPV